MKHRWMVAAAALLIVASACSSGAETTTEAASRSTEAEPASSTSVAESSTTTSPPSPEVEITSVPADFELTSVVPAGYGWFGREPEGRDLLRSTDGLVWEPIETQPYQTTYHARLIPFGEGYLKVEFSGRLDEPILFTPDGVNFTEFDDPDGLIPHEAGVVVTLGPSASLTEKYWGEATSSYPAWPCDDITSWGDARSSLYTEAGGEPVLVRAPWQFARQSFLFEGGFGVLIESEDGPFCDGKQTARLGVWVWRSGSGFELAVEIDHVPDRNLDYYGLRPEVVMAEDGRAIIAASEAPYISTDATLTAWTEIELPGSATILSASPYGRAIIAQESIGGRAWAMKLDSDWVELPLEEPVLLIPVAADASAVIMEDVGTAISGRQRIRAEW